MSAYARSLALLGLLAPGLRAEDGAEARIVAAMTAVIAQVELADGVDAAEAQTLAAAYFGSAVSGCGGIGTARPGEGGWIAESRIGIAGSPGPTVIVAGDGRTIRAAGHATVSLVDGKVTVAVSDP